MIEPIILMTAGLLLDICGSILVILLLARSVLSFCVIFQFLHMFSRDIRRRQCQSIGIEFIDDDDDFLKISKKRLMRHYKYSDKNYFHL